MEPDCCWCRWSQDADVTGHHATCHLTSLCSGALWHEPGRVLVLAGGMFLRVSSLRGSLSTCVTLHRVEGGSGLPPGLSSEETQACCSSPLDPGLWADQTLCPSGPTQSECIFSAPWRLSSLPLGWEQPLPVDLGFLGLGADSDPGGTLSSPFKSPSFDGTPCICQHCSVAQAFFPATEEDIHGFKACLSRTFLSQDSLGSSLRLYIYILHVSVSWAYEDVSLSPARAGSRVSQILPMA